MTEKNSFKYRIQSEIDFVHRDLIYCDVYICAALKVKLKTQQNVSSRVHIDSADMLIYAAVMLILLINYC